ncbi:GMC family oxidoreductase [Roseovarius atlanticus]|uniref:GMC family oxidoreductase n=1 Tax=Roseovarius atlanticus TaxID=1641875 RepID=UPI001C956315|nr:GMC family oxidoreductase [Roseovarius atlanticus]MBY5990017.1 GMC family oxidoreductase [Roseovarius atlanticus]MBY6126562.1 GMC family oxidoreductase [Roseovarius atlanticus]MBY6151056.1 GMC family oxidoreductase [Roseovarius atlanticus]
MSVSQLNTKPRRPRRDEEVDVLIVGAGPSGSVAALELAKAGMSVVVMEQGDWPEYADYTGARPEHELVSTKLWHPNPNVRDNPRDYPVDTSTTDINPLMYAGVGGSANLYGAQWMHFLPSDFRVRSLDGVADDWPMSYEELLPYQLEIERQVGVSGLSGDPAYPPRGPYPFPALPMGSVGYKGIEGQEKMGWHWWPGSNAIPSEQHGQLNPCVRRGTCLTGCPEGAKSTTDRSHWPMALKAGAMLITNARVSEIETNDEGLATGVVYFDANGRQRRQKAKVVILCANGVGTPRLLLMSGGEDGLANSSGLVGKRLMMHPFASVLASFPDPLDSWRGPFGQQIYSLEFYETDESRGFVRGSKWNCMPSGGPVGVSGAIGSKVYVSEEGDYRDFWGGNLHDNVARRFGHSLIWGIVGEDLPEESNQVVLSSDLTDSDGLPAPQIRYQVNENSNRLLQFNIDRCLESVRAAGAVETLVSTPVRESGWHLIGTTVMGADPKTSVVDQWGAAHDVPNLYVMDASTFPTSGATNPTATIMAVALRNTRRLIAERRNQKVA